MIKIPDIIEAMEQRDAESLERMLVEHVEHFVDRLREETMKKFWFMGQVENIECLIKLRNSGPLASGSQSRFRDNRLCL